jgi:hypothetical protein
VHIQGTPPEDDTTGPIIPLPIVTQPALLPAPNHPLADNVADDNGISTDTETIGFSEVLANLIVTELACISIQSNTR